LPLLLLLLLPCRLISARLQSFQIPWNDASSGITSLQSWQAAVTIDQSRVLVDPNGHYSLNGQRVRFLGVNAAATDAFPTHANAEIHAARLARFGFNSVRLHHLEAPWAKDQVLVDYAAGNSRTLSADRLEKLQYFVAQLAQHGLYVDLNLLVSREFQATDGLGSEITQLGWKDQQVLGFFMDEALALHKEYATKVLSASNPYRGNLSFAQDPAVAVVEIMNENGFLQKWHDGVLDTLPASYATRLQQRWNAWLKTRYKDTASMLSAWGAVNQGLGQEILANGDFTAGAGSWFLEQHSGAVGQTVAGTDFSGKPSLKINVTSAGTQGWHVQLTQGPVKLEGGKVYTLSFWAKSPTAIPLYCGVGRAYGDYAYVSPTISATLGTEWRQYSASFQVAATDDQLRVSVNGFGDRVCSAIFAAFSLRPGGVLGGIPTGASLEAGTVPVVTKVPGALAPTPLQRRDFMTWLLEAEKAYWTEMRHHIKDTLGFGGPVWGTIIANSPPNEQAAMDALDSHAYWQHPTWPTGLEWDTVQWSIPNTSMVNDPAGGTLAGIARQRAKGYPHNVTEYQHPSPNSYSAEGVLLSAAYAGLQDWDGIWHFDYQTGTTEGITGFFDHGGHPGRMVNNLIAACLFRRGDVGLARREYDIAFSPLIELNAAVEHGGAWNVADGGTLGVPATLTMESRLALVLDAGLGLTDMPAAPTGAVRTADTGSLVWDNSLANQGVVTVNTPLTKAVIGFAAGRSFKLGEVSIVPATSALGWSTIAISLLEGRGFGHAAGGRALIVATGQVENTGMVWKDATHTSIGDKWGTAPTLVETVAATIQLPVPSTRVKAWALDVRGQRAGALTPESTTDGGTLLRLGSAGTTLWYEVELSAGAPVAPSISAQPLAVVVDEGQPASFSVTVEGFPQPTVQWYQGETLLPAATATTLTIGSVTKTDAGSYHAVLSNTQGQVRTRDASLQLRGSLSLDNSRLVNVSTRGQVGRDSEAMISGFVLEGGRSLLLRGIGPRLADFGLSGLLSNPRMDLFLAGSTSAFAGNDDWVPADTLALFDKVGAFGLGSSTREAVLSATLVSGGYTCVLKGSAGETGLALLEGYDLGTGTGRIKNLSTRALAGADSEALIVGFSISGSQARKVLIRAVGPTLRNFGISSSVDDPTLTLYQMQDGKSLELGRNDDWEDFGAGPAASAAFAAVGAFALPTGSRDAALVLWLEPGLYSAMMQAKAGKALGIVEVYELE
jgi:hypothetical protein